MRDFKLIKETTLSRVWRHFTNAKIPVGMISAYTKVPAEADSGEVKRLDKENLSRNKRLASEVSAAGYGYVFVDGKYRYKDGVMGDEQTLLIVGGEKDNGRLQGLLQDWADKYDQESVLFKAEGTTKASLLYASGKLEPLGSISPDKVADIYTKLKGRGDRTFTFEKAVYPFSWMENMLRENMITNHKLSEKEIAQYRRYC